MKKIKNISGKDINIYYDKKVDTLTLELGIIDETPVIELWNNNKKILTLHLKEAIELKSIIDILTLEYNERDEK